MKRLMMIILLLAVPPLPLHGAPRGRDGHELRARLTGFQETPLTLASSARGQFLATISEDETSIDFQLSYQGFGTDVGAAHIHLGLSLAKTRSRRLNPRNARSALSIMAAIEHADGHHVAGATELSVSARRRRRRRQDRPASADRTPIRIAEGRRSKRLRRAADVAVVEAADVGQGNDAAVLGWLDGARLGCILLEGKMRPRAVVVAEVAVQTTTQMSLVQDDHVVEKLAADGSDDALREGVLPRRAWCREDLGDAHALHPSPKLAAVNAVAIAEEEARRRVIGEGFDNLLCRPAGRGGVRD